MKRQKTKEEEEIECEDRDFLEDKDLIKKDYVGRAPLQQQIDENKDSVEFMNIDVDYYQTEASKLPDYLGLEKVTEHAVIRIFGVNAAGNSVLAHVHQFHSYFYVEIIEQHMGEISEEDLIDFKNQLNAMLSPG